MTVKKLKGDIVRKEGMLNAMQAELDKVGVYISVYVMCLLLLLHHHCTSSSTLQLQC